MSDAKHTPGPWTISRYAENAVTGPNDRGICSTGGYQSNVEDPEALDAENRANAHLIAAAPDLLAALRAEQAWRDFNPCDIDPADPDYAFAQEAWNVENRRLYVKADRLRAIALAKAGGESDV